MHGAKARLFGAQVPVARSYLDATGKDGEYNETQHLFRKLCIRSPTKLKSSGELRVGERRRQLTLRDMWRS